MHNERSALTCQVQRQRRDPEVRVRKPSELAGINQQHVALAAHFAPPRVDDGLSVDCVHVKDRAIAQARSRTVILICLRVADQDKRLVKCEVFQLWLN